jgi:hypothetical protein
MTVPHFIPVSVWEKASNNWTSTWQARHFQLFYRRLPMRKDRGRQPQSLLGGATSSHVGFLLARTCC